MLTAEWNMYDSHRALEVMPAYVLMILFYFAHVVRMDVRRYIHGHGDNNNNNNHDNGQWRKNQFCISWQVNWVRSAHAISYR